MIISTGFYKNSVTFNKLYSIITVYKAKIIKKQRG